MNRPLLYDVFCGAGGATRGYQDAGFQVVGIDNRPQPRYCGDEFIQSDAFTFFARVEGGEFPLPSAWHASPPCQGYSRMRHLPWLKDRTYPRLIDPVRELLERSGVPWVIENVEDAPLLNGITLCGMMFGLPLYRHRKFESNVLLLAPPHMKHRAVIGSGRMLNDRAAPSADGFVSLVGKGNKTQFAASQRAMGIDWMNRDELSQAIPPAYTHWIGTQLLRVVEAQEVA